MLYPFPVVGSYSWLLRQASNLLKQCYCIYVMCWWIVYAATWLSALPSPIKLKVYCSMYVAFKTYIFFKMSTVYIVALSGICMSITAVCTTFDTVIIDFSVLNVSLCDYCSLCDELVSSSMYALLWLMYMQYFSL